MSAGLTPMIRQYLKIKEQQKDSILFFRLGDFYEMFFDDAKEASRILHITLTSRGSSKGGKVPMCGIPHHAADSYIARLIKNGKKVAICEQMEESAPSAGRGSDPSVARGAESGKKIVERKIVKVITPGTFIADELLEASVNNYLLSVYPRGESCGMAYADISTGEFRVTELHDQEDFFAELYKISPSECLVPESFTQEKRFHDIRDANSGLITVHDDWLFDYEFSLKELKDHFSVRDLSGFGCQDMELAICAAGALLKYLKSTQRSSLSNIDAINTYSVSQFMTLDRNSQRNLELIQNMEDLSQKGTLLEVLDKAKTPMGKRRLKQWILNPLLDMEGIKERLDAVQYFYDETAGREHIGKVLDRVYDIDRLSNKVSLGSANGRDLAALSSSLKNIGELRRFLTGPLPKKLEDIASRLDSFQDVTTWIDECVTDDPPIAVKEGGLIRPGYDAEADELRDMIANGKDWLTRLKEREVRRTGISSLKVAYNRIFGYYIEVTNANLDSVPTDYIRKQTLINAERFITDELKRYESKIIGAEERIKAVEYGIFCRLRDRVGREIERLKRTACCVADLDVLVVFSEVAVKNGYVRPEVNSENVLRITDGRHPVLERLLRDKEFVPNDVNMGREEGNIFIITGSNMAGKSTFIRQVALITIMAQMGSFVPAGKAVISVVDRVFTRVGASDRLHRGMSTFMVEMLETANILNNATRGSLIILDEIGRGTSTFDGVSIAWAVVEYICRHLSDARTLFATHFHELTELSQIFNGVRNYNLAVREWRDEVIFLYKVVEGNCDESFGVHVAKLAGMPDGVVSRAREILNNLQKDSLLGNICGRFSLKSAAPERQLNFFETGAGEDPVIGKLRELDLNSLTPIDALKKMEEFKKEIDGAHGHDGIKDPPA
ncbi:MAG: DNA mismatch repair protein MutS [Candidatus Omnitrophica bacterium]|nr:DNA mismatch repair protein MutS [Candidatus Omnitrophota bacterium]